MEYDSKSEAKKDEFQNALKMGSVDKTVSEVLEEMSERTRIRIRSINSIEVEGESGSNILAVYKDGIALTHSERFSNGTGTRFHYALHRNDEDKAYVLDTQRVLEKDHFSLKS